MILLVILIGVVLSFVVGAIASDRKLGFAGGFFLSLLLSPVVGLIIALLSEPKKKFEEVGQSPTGLPRQTLGASEKSLSDELLKVKSLFDQGTISEKEFVGIVSRLIDSIGHVESPSQLIDPEDDQSDDVSGSYFEIVEEIEQEKSPFLGKSYTEYTVTFSNELKGKYYKNSKGFYMYDETGSNKLIYKDKESIQRSLHSLLSTNKVDYEGFVEMVV